MRLRSLGCMAPIAGSLLALGTVYSLSGCGSGEGGSGGLAGFVSQLVNAATGGTVTNGNASVTIPPNALSANTTITIQQGGTTPTAPAGMQVIPNTTFQFGPSGTPFSTPATLKIGFSPAGLNGSAEGSLVIARVNGGTFQTIAGTVDQGGNRVSAQISSFSTYCLLGSTVSLDAAAFAGNWTGRWVNTTFGSQNDVTMAVTVNETTRSAAVTLRIFGNVLGSFTDPPAENYTGTWDDTQFTINANSTIFGSATLAIDPTGNLTGTADTTTNTQVSRVTVTGTASPSGINATYTVRFRDNSTATGTLNLTKTVP